LALAAEEIPLIEAEIAASSLEKNESLQSSSESEVLYEIPEKNSSSFASLEEEIDSEMIVSQVIEGNQEDLLVATEPEGIAESPVAFSSEKIDSLARLPLQGKSEEVVLTSQEIASAQDKIMTSIPGPIQIDFKQVYSGSPFIYSILFLLSIAAFGIWLFNTLLLRQVGKTSDTFVNNLRSKLLSNQYDEALNLCSQNQGILSKMIAIGILSRSSGTPVMLDIMKAEGKRMTVSFWQRIAILNDIAIIAPMLGLLGTVLGMFYAFYDINRSMESVSTLFDGLGISVGTTVAGLIVAILALLLHSLAKYRLVRLLSKVENEVHTFASVLDNKTSITQDK